MDGIHALGQEIAHGPLHKIRFQDEGAGGGLLCHAFLDLSPLVE